MIGLRMTVFERPRSGICALAAALVLAGTAQAQTAAGLALSPARLAPAAMSPASELARAAFARSSAVDLPAAPLTAIDHRFASSDALVGSVGYLCGLQPGHYDSGAASTYGPAGTFLGAKLSLAFK